MLPGSVHMDASFSLLVVGANAKPLYVVPKSIATTVMYDELAENNKTSWRTRTACMNLIDKWLFSC